MPSESVPALTAEELQELERLHEAARDDFPLPWEYDESNGEITDAGGTIHYEGQDFVWAGRLTVAAVNALPSLLQAARRAEAAESVVRAAEAYVAECDGSADRTIIRETHRHLMDAARALRSAREGGREDGEAR